MKFSSRVTTDSSTGGYLVPSSAQPLEDVALDAFLQGAIVSMTGLPQTLVRPSERAATFCTGQRAHPARDVLRRCYTGYSLLCQGEMLSKF
jgi:hypothetical protein